MKDFRIIKWHQFQRLMQEGLLIIVFILMGNLITDAVEPSYKIYKTSVNKQSEELDTKYVSNSGSDSNPGTKDEPFKTIEEGIEQLKPGDTLLIREGIYYERLYIDISGELDQRITIKNYPLEKAIIDGRNKSDSNDLLYLDHVSFLTIEGLEFRNNKDILYPTAITIEGYGESVDIINNRIYDIHTDRDGHAICVYGTNGNQSYHSIRIIGNEVFDCSLGSSEAVCVNGNIDKFNITHNVIYNINNIGIDCIGFEGTSEKNDQARNGIVANNVVHHIDSTENLRYDGDGCAAGIYVDGGKNIQIFDNYIYDCNIGIEVSSEHYNKSVTNISVHGNEIYDSSLYGISLGGAERENGTAKNNYIYMNELYNNAISIAFQQAVDNKIYENIIVSQETIYEGDISNNEVINNKLIELSYLEDLNKFLRVDFVDEEKLLLKHHIFKLMTKLVIYLE